ncbi:uncharacterized protein LOC119728951 isoform X2 [Patiria miniata]|uniref:Serotonin N-acetyltransferase n=1 Tax=Patiria miniata TaxID=46514 RepID=A0A914A1V3_PATMI|nr:uncharacterized protein LOC119728951 isoform X2 [Patiria miniata]
MENMASPDVCIRKVTEQEVHDAWLIGSLSFPSDETASEERCKFRQREAPDLFWGYYESGKLISGVATALMKHLIQHVRDNLVNVTKICLLCHDFLVAFYESVGFQCLGLSQVTFGQMPWYNMVCNIQTDK